MQLSHSPRLGSAVFDEPNLVSAAGLVPVVGLAERAGLRELADEYLSVATDRGANAGLKVTSLVAGMAAGADSIDDMALLRHGGMGRIFDRAYAPSTLGSFLRSFTFGHVRQLDAVASRLLTGLVEQAPAAAGVDDMDDYAVVGEQLPAGSLYRLLADEGHRLFGDDYFADLFAPTRRGRPSVPARTVATVMLLQGS